MSNLNITILSTQTINTTSKTGKPLQQLEVAYKNNTFGGKVESKKLFGFGANKPAFEALTGAAQGSSFDITVSKNDAGYNDWTSCKPAGATAPATPSSTGQVNEAKVQVKSTYETPEERAKKQVYIIRQSSISSAISALGVGAKSAPTSDAVLQLADVFFQWVMQDPEKTVKQDLVNIPNDFPDVE